MASSPENDAIPVHEQHPAVTLSPLLAIKTAWQYKRFIPTVISTSLSFYLNGPIEEAWPLEIALFTALCREASSARKPSTEVVDPIIAIQRFRKIAAVEKLLPPPKNGFASQVLIEVKKDRVLDGVLKGLEEREEKSGRTIKAEWVVHNKFINSSTPTSNHVVLYFHGGAYALMSPASHRSLAIAMSESMDNARVFSVDYRLAPEAPFPRGLRDAVEAYYYLIESGVPAANIIVSGDSAGGGLSMALLLYLRDHVHLPDHAMIGGAILLSPWTDLTSSCGSWVSNKDRDYLTVSDSADKTLDMAHLYVGHANYLDLVIHPYVSSCVADLSNLPPMLIQSGGAEVLRDEITLLAQRAVASGVQVEYVVLDGGIHVAQAFLHTELSKVSIGQMGSWLTRQIAPKAFDATIIDARIHSNQLPSKSSTSVGEKPKATRFIPFTFTLIDQEAPIVTLRPDAHPAVQAVWEDLSKSVAEKGGVGFTKLLKANRTEGGVWQHARSVLHL